MSRVESGRGPLGQKEPKPDKTARKPMRKVSRKRQQRHQSKEGQEGLTYMGRVKMLACVACGAPGPNDAHHCKDMPPYTEQGLYERLPAGGRKSGASDTIPLCELHHWTFHNRRREFHALYGPDYTYIGPTRAALSHMEIDF